jgi:hypothetical protein
MKFKAINTEGKEIVAKYFVGSNEDIKNWCKDETLIEKYGTDLCFMFDDTIGWIDGAELDGIFKDVAFTNSVEMIKE